MVRTILIILCVLAAILAGIYVFDRPRLERALSGTPLELPATTTKVFKWQDSEGNWHITDQPPAEGVKFEALNYRSNDNIMPLAPVDE